MTTKEETAAYCDRQADSMRDSKQADDHQHEKVWRDRAEQLRQPSRGGLAEAKECIDVALFEIGDRFTELPDWMQDIWQRRVMYVLGIEEGGNG